MVAAIPAVAPALQASFFIARVLVGGLDVLTAVATVCALTHNGHHLVPLEQRGDIISFADVLVGDGVHFRHVSLFVRLSAACEQQRGGEREGAHRSPAFHFVSPFIVFFPS